MVAQKVMLVLRAALMHMGCAHASLVITVAAARKAIARQLIRHVMVFIEFKYKFYLFLE